MSKYYDLDKDLGEESSSAKMLGLFAGIAAIIILLTVGVNSLIKVSHAANRSEAQLSSICSAILRDEGHTFSNVVYDGIASGGSYNYWGNGRKPEGRVKYFRFKVKDFNGEGTQLVVLGFDAVRSVASKGIVCPDGSGDYLIRGCLSHMFKEES